jgi:type I restriction enzyme, S subunit
MGVEAPASFLDVAPPHGWDCLALADLVESDRDITYGIVQPGIHDPAGIPIVRVNNLRNGRIETDDLLKVSPEIEARYERTRLRGGEILLSLVGTLGECAVVPRELAGWNVARAVAVIPIKEGVDARWVAVCLRSQPLQHLMRMWATTTVQATLNLRDVRRLPVVLPPKTETDVIMPLVGALDGKIELNRRMNVTLEAMARAIFKSWFIDFEPVKAKAAGAAGFRGMPQDVFDRLPDQLIDSELGPIPWGWEVAPLDELMEINPQRLLKRGDEAPYLEMSDMPTQGHAPERWQIRAYGSGMRFRNGDTLLARITPCLENGKTAFVDFLPPGRIGWGSTEYIVFRPRPPLPPIYAYCLARSPEFRDFTITNMTGTSGRQRVAASALAHFMAVRPAEPIAIRFGAMVEPMFARIAVNHNQSRTLGAIRDALLPKLISGKIRVPGAEVVNNGR